MNRSSCINTANSPKGLLIQLRLNDLNWNKRTGKKFYSLRLLVFEEGCVFLKYVMVSAGYSEDSDYTSDLNYPIGQHANSSASQFRSAAGQMHTPNRSLETSRENSYERDDAPGHHHLPQVPLTHHHHLSPGHHTYRHNNQVNLLSANNKFK